MPNDQNGLPQNGLSQVQSASMRKDGREMDVTWKSGAQEAFEKAGFHVVGDFLHDGVTLHEKGKNVEGLHLVFPDGPSRQESQVHIDYRSGFAHFGSRNDDVIYNEEKYGKWYGPLPGLIQ
jgi:hypothetical protein